MNYALIEKQKIERQIIVHYALNKKGCIFQRN